MSETQHTPGPWHWVGLIPIPSRMIKTADSDPSHVSVVRWGDPKEKADVCICVGPDQEANARLIAAAPDLLEALEALVAYNASLIPGSPKREARIKLARKAIAKAKGEA